MITYLLFALGATCLMLAIHPFITYPLSLWLMNKVKRRHELAQAATGSDGNFAICMCAYNEEQVIESKMHNLLALRAKNPDIEILIYVDAASDRTAELLAPYADQIYLHVSPKRYGKTHGMNLLVAKTQAPYILFTDANVMIDLDAIENLRRYFSDPRVGCVCGNLLYTNGAESVTAATGSLYWKLEERIKAFEQATGSVMGADGSLFAIRHYLHHAPPDHIIDDMYVSFRILCDGYRIVQAHDVKAYERSVTIAADEFKRKARIACQAFNVHRLLWPLLKKMDTLTIYKYISHKLLRWWSIYFLAASLLCIELGLLAAQLPGVAMMLLALTVLTLWLGKRSAMTPFAQVVDILLSLLGAGIGVWKSMRGEQYQTWQPSNSVRELS